MRRFMIWGAVALALSSCQTFQSRFGEPLTEFHAVDGAYFPPFILAFFDNAADSVRKQPSIAEARSGINLIQVKALNEDPLPRNEANLSWSADGVYLSFERVQGANRKILLTDMARHHERELAVIPRRKDDFLAGIVPRAIESYNAGLSWSRDSTRFAFMSNGGVGEYNIYVGAVGLKEKPVTQSHSKEGYATWSPVANELALVSACSGRGDIYVLELDRDRIEKVSDSDNVDIFPEWFPNGKKLVFSSGDASSHNVMIAERDAYFQWQKPRFLTQSRRDLLRPTVSPDGRFLAFYGKDAHFGWNIHVVPTDGDAIYDDPELDRRVIARNVVVDLNTGPAWSPDSQKIFFVKNDTAQLNPIQAYELFSGRSYLLRTGTRMNRDILMSRLGVLSFRAQVGVWDRVFVALTNQGLQLQKAEPGKGEIIYDRP